MTRTLLITLISTPIIYLLIALAFTLYPVERDLHSKTLDFSVLPTGLTNQTGGIESFYTARDGQKLFFRHFPSDAKTTLILIHGSGSDGRYLTLLADKLSTSSKASIVIPDLRGHGRSMLDAPGDVSYLGLLEDDLEDLAMHVKGLNLGTITALGGHSSGGGLALKYGGNHHATSFDGYLLLAPYMGYNAPTIKPNSGGWVQASTRKYIGLSMLNNVGITLLNDQPVVFFNRPPEWDNPLQVDNYTYRLNESFSPQDYVRALEQNKKPILVLVGEGDDAFYPTEYEPMFSAHAPHAELQILPNLKHLNLPSSEATYEKLSHWLANL
ncbi:alpha/beta fold hydrolase [Pseudomonadales bacterium]|nr:alpha/beta fold hydrolase [Pseudomonadales bacterium]